jgi:hypothetical protein
VAELIDEIGFDAVDAGTLAEGGRKQRVGAPAYTQGIAVKRCAPALRRELILCQTRRDTLCASPGGRDRPSLGPTQRSTEYAQL